jgi:hypothetical protein
MYGWIPSCGRWLMDAWRAYMANQNTQSCETVDYPLFSDISVFGHLATVLTSCDDSDIVHPIGGVEEFGKVIWKLILITTAQRF